MKSICGIFLIILLFLAFPRAAFAATWYVSPTGSDTNPGTQPQPFRTVPKGINTAASGDTIQISAGTYDLAGFGPTLTKAISLIGANRDTTILTGGTSFTLHTRINVSNLTFRRFSTAASDATVFKLQADAGETIDGILIDNNRFENVQSAVWSRNSSGTIRNFTFTNNVLTNLSGPNNVYGVAITNGTITNITITGNTITNIGSTNSTRDVLGIYLGKDANPIPIDTALIKNNTITNLRGGSVASGTYHPCGRAIIAYGNNITIDGNAVSEIDQQSEYPRNCIYIKGSNSRLVNNVVHNCGSRAGSGSGDVSIKGETGTGNIVAGNHITSSQTQGNNHIYIKGEVTVENNYVRSTAPSRIITAYEATSKIINIRDNYFETAGYSPAIQMWDVGGGEITRNVIINPGGSNYGISGSASGIRVSDNRECTAANCAPLIPAIPKCQNTGNYCISGCGGTILSQYASTCSDALFCCSVFSASIGATPTPPSAGITGDANGDNLVDEADYTIWKSHYGQAVSGASNGNFNGDGVADGKDYVVWMGNYGR